VNNKRARVLVVDDDAAVTSLLRRGFTYEGYDVAIARSGPEALKLARDRPPALVVLDVMMPEMDGFEVCRRLRDADPSLPVLLLTARDAPGDQVTGLDIGADDYVVKPFTFEVLAARVRALLRRKESHLPDVLVFEDLRLDVGTRIAHRGRRAIHLTTTEFELLQLLMSNPRQVLTKDYLMKRIWGYGFGGNVNIVEVYIAGLRRKLEEGNERRLIQTIRGAGYALRGE
jgi:two-component system response regulator MprA